MQSVENLADVWFGLVELLKLVKWQLTQSVGVSPVNPLVWQLAQVTVVWAPTSGKTVVVL